MMTIHAPHAGGLPILDRRGFLFLVVGMSATGPVRGQQAPAGPPPAGSTRWFYERGLVQLVFERYADAERDLDSALRKQPKYVEALYARAVLLERMRRPPEAVEAYRAVLAASPVEHLPARLKLIAVLQETDRSREAVPHVEFLVKHLQMGGPDTIDRRIQLQVALGDAARRPARLSDAVEQLRDRIAIFLTDAPTRYRAATIDAGLQDELVALEFVAAQRKQDGATDTDVAATLRTTIAARGNFSPLAYLQLGECEERRTRLPEAVSAFGTAVNQLHHLGFSETNGDYSGDHYRELEQRLKTKPATTPVKP